MKKFVAISWPRFLQMQRRSCSSSWEMWRSLPPADESLALAGRASSFKSKEKGRRRRREEKGPEVSVDLPREVVRREVPVAGDVLRLVEVSLKQRFTEQPLHLSESELLALMDRHGIGTDASMASHVGNVQRRLVLPTVRASIENACARVARGEAQKARVVE
eukprot:Skav202747  [mRNA]  locus=scaffold1326:474310:477771:- [translate_table: standard]